MAAELNNADVVTSNFNNDESQALNLETVSSDLTDLLDKRLEGWLSMARSLSDYFREVAEFEESICKKLTKTSDTLKLPVSDLEKVQFQHVEEPGIVKLLCELRKNNLQIAEHHEAAANFITNTTIAELKLLKTDIKKLLKDNKNNHSSLNMKFAKARETSKTSYKKLARTIGEIIDIHQFDGEDPWIVHQSFQRQMKTDLSEDAAYQEKIKESVVHIKEFEDQVMVRFKTILSGYYNWRKEDLASTQEQMESAVSLTDQIPNDSEWNAFLEKYPNQLKLLNSDVKPTDSIERTLSTLEYPLKTHEFVQTQLASNVMRRSGISPFKSWKDQHLVLTNTGFIYGFPDSDLLAHRDPELSLQAKKCQLVIGKTDNEFEIVGKSLGGGIFTTEKAHQFRASSPEELSKWTKALQKWIGVTEAPNAVPAVAPEAVAQAEPSEKAAEPEAVAQESAASVLPSTEATPVKSDEPVVSAPLDTTIVSSDPPVISEPAPPSSKSSIPSLSVVPESGLSSSPAVPTVTNTAEPVANPAPAESSTAT